MADEDLETAVFCYFILGTAFPGVWGLFFLLFSLNPDSGDFLATSQCQELNMWGFIAAIILFAIAIFYLILILVIICSTSDLDNMYI